MSTTEQGKVQKTRKAYTMSKITAEESLLIRDFESRLVNLCNNFSEEMSAIGADDHALFAAKHAFESTMEGWICRRLMEVKNGETK